MNKKFKIAIIGSTGYTGAELVKILLKHSGVELSYLTSHSFAGKDFCEVYPEFKGKFSYQLRQFSSSAPELKDIALAFIALPHGHAMQTVQELLQKNIKVIDLGADFRYRDVTIYEQNYQKHTAVKINEKAVYGLPEYFRQQIKNAELIANPGCYVTAATLALKPLIDSGNFEAGSIIVDAKSGYSGAGREVVEKMKFPEDNLKFRAYKIGNHRHQSEIEQNLGTSVLFSAHLLPLFRGILSTSYVDLKPNQDFAAIQKIYQDKYSAEPFVKVVEQLPDIADVTNSNYCHIYLNHIAKMNKLVVVSVLDNLVKGASGQAVQNMNLMLGFPENQGF